MSRLAKELMEELRGEEDRRVLEEVLHFYEYLRDKKNRALKDKWLDIDKSINDENQLYQ